MTPELGPLPPLLPCPFCGKPASFQRFEFGGAPFRAVSCCMADTGRRRTEEEAAALWNTRAAQEVARKASSGEDAAREAAELRERLTAMFPLFEEARDALTAIPLTAAKLHHVRLDLADRMDAVGDPKRWAARGAGAK